MIAWNLERVARSGPVKERLSFFFLKTVPAKVQGKVNKLWARAFQKGKDRAEEKLMKTYGGSFQIKSRGEKVCFSGLH